MLDEQMKWLVELQRADSRLGELDRLRIELPRKIEEISHQIQAEQARFQKAQEHLEEMKALRRKKERDLEVETERIKKSQSRLFEIKTNKEYQALLKEIEQAKEANSVLEEEILLLMEEVDKAAEQLVSMQENLAEAESGLSGKREFTQSQLDGLETESIKWQKQRKEAAEKIDSGWIAHYDKIAQRNNGVAVVRVEGGTCQGCFLNIPPQLYNEILKSGHVAKCPFCMRFIFCLTNDTRMGNTG
jgi:predicted  nucleic acid-binding Zn-ribbon protein